MTARPRLKDGRFVSTDCPVCGCGTLQQETPNEWRCDGLRDPEDQNKELEACEYGIYFGEIVGLPSNAALRGDSGFIAGVPLEGTVMRI